MLKHVQISPLRNRADSVSLRSSTSCASSMCGSPEPPGGELQRTPSRASSYSSLNEHLPQTTIKVFTNCLKIDIEYKTLGIQWDTTSKEVIAQLLRRLKMRHRDPRLFYLSMEVLVRRAGVKTILVLDEDTRPAIMQACHPKGESRFCLQLKPGGLIRVHTSALQPSSQYKSLIISEETTSDELLQLLLSCYNSVEPVEQFSIYEVCPGQEYQRKLHPDDIPLRAQAERMKRGESCHFLVRRNPGYARRRQLLNALNEVYASGATTSNNSSAKNNNNNNNSNNNNNNVNGNKKSSDTASNKSFDANSSISSTEDETSFLDVSIESLTEELQNLMMASDEDEDCGSSTSSSSDTSSEGSTTVRRTPSNLSVVPLKRAQMTLEICNKCRNSFRSCEFCHKNSALIQYQQRPQQQQQLQKQPIRPTTLAVTAIPTNIKGVQLQLPTYNPVYNIREIRTASHSFSSLGSDKKLLDIQINGHFDATLSLANKKNLPVSATPITATCRMRPQNVFLGRATRMIVDTNANQSHAVVMVQPPPSPKMITGADMNGNPTTTSKTMNVEAVNNNPAKGLGHFVYL